MFIYPDCASYHTISAATSLTNEKIMADDHENKDVLHGIELHENIATGEDSNTESDFPREAMNDSGEESSTESDLPPEAANDSGEQLRFQIESLSLHALTSEDETTTSALPGENSDFWNIPAQNQDTDSNQDNQSREETDDVPGALGMDPESVRLDSDWLLKSQRDHINQLLASLLAGTMGDEIMSQPCYMPDIDSKLRNIFMEEHASLRLAQSTIWAEHTILKYSAYTFDGRKISQKHLKPQDVTSLVDVVSEEPVSSITGHASWTLILSRTRNSFSQIPLPVLALFKDFSIIRKRLGLVPCLGWQVKSNQHHGLGRRFVPCDRPEGLHHKNYKGKGKAETNRELRNAASPFYHIWFFLPFSNIHTEEEKGIYSSSLDNPEYERVFASLNMLGTHLPNLGLSFEDTLLCFYLKIDLKSRKMIVFCAGSIFEQQRFEDTCERGSQHSLSYDPFVFICAAISEILDSWAERSVAYFDRLRATESLVTSLGSSFDSETEGSEVASKEEMQRMQLKKARELMLDLHSLRSYQFRQTDYLEILQKIVQDSIEEHKTVRDMLEIENSHFLRVDKNLVTINSWVQSTSSRLKSAGVIIQNNLSFLSNLIELRNNYSIEDNTRYLANLATKTRDDEYGMKLIAEATRMDSRAMKTIAQLTMLYLPGSFVATLFSMGFFNFSFDEDSKGNVALSTSWWLYPVITFPLTAGTFLFFWLMQRLQGRNDQ